MKRLNVGNEELILLCFSDQDYEMIGSTVFGENDSNVDYLAKQTTITK